MQIVKFTYSGSATRKLNVSGRDQVIVSGDDNSTQFIFTFPPQYQNYTKFIKWGDFYIETEDGTPTQPIYPLQENDTFHVPSEVTYGNSGKEIHFQIQFYEMSDSGNSTFIENSLLFPVYVSKSTTNKKIKPSQSDVLSVLMERAYVSSMYDVDLGENRPYLQFTSLAGKDYKLVLNMPYLDEESGKIPYQFLPQGVNVEVIPFSNIAEMMEDDSALPPDFAVITEGTEGSAIDYPLNIFIKTYEETEYNGWLLIHSQYVVDKFDTKVDKIEGKGLSTNDFTNAYRNKLGGIEAGAEVNAIESISIDGVVQSIDSNRDVALDLSNYVTKGDYQQALKYKGSVQTYANLPQNPSQGDVYNIQQADPSHGIKQGDNVAWTGTEWDVLQGTVDLSDYYTIEQTDALLDEKADLTDFTQLGERVSQAESDIDDLEVSVGQAGDQASQSGSVYARIQQNQQDIATLDSTKADDQDLQALEGRVTTAESDISGLTDRVTTAESDIDSLESRMTTAEGDIDANADQISSLQSDVSTIQQNYATKQTVQQGSYTRVSVTSEGVVSAGSNDLGIQDISGLQDQLDSKTDDTDFSALEGRVDVAEQDIDQLEGRADVLESDVSSLQDRADAVDGEITSIKGRLDTAESDIDNIEGQIGDQSTENTIIYRIKTQEDDIDQIESTLGDANSGLIKDVQTLQTEVEQTTTGLLDRMTVAEGNIQQAQQDITDIEAEFGNYYTKTEADDLLDDKVDKVSGKQLSTEDFTTALKTKLEGIEAGAEVNVQADWTEQDTTSDQYILHKPTLGTAQQLDVGTTEGTIPVLGPSGKLPNSTIPPLAIGELIPWPEGVESTVQNLVLLSDAEKGDIAVVSDDTINNNGIYFLNGVYSNVNDWIQIVGPSNVISVNGYSGVVTIGLADLTGITQAELNAIDSGITSSLVQQISTNESDISTINSSQPMQSGITSEKVQTYDAYAQQIQGKIVKIDSPTAGTLVVSTQTGDVAESSTLTTKLNSIESGAEVNIIESISIDGVNQVPDANRNVQLNLTAYALDSDLSQLDSRVTTVEGEIGDQSTTGTILYRIGQNESAISSLQSDKVDKVSGYSLVSDTEIAKLQTVEEDAQENVIEVVKVNDTQLDVTNKTVNIDLSGYVEKVAGKQLSTEDFTTAFKTKLEGIEAGAQQNIIEQVSMNGTALPISNKTVQLTVDTTPTENSANPITSGAVYTLKSQVDTNTQDIATINASDVMNSGITQAKVQTYDDYQISKQDTITATPNTVLVADQNGVVVSSTITSLELSQLSGISENIQQQLDNKTPYDMAIGVWDSTITYHLNSTVIYEGNLYISISDGDNLNHEPGTEETGYWAVIEGGGGTPGTSSAIVRVIGDGVRTEYTINHGFGTYDFFHSIRYDDPQNMAYVDAEVYATSLNTAKIKFAEAPAVNSIRVILSPGASGDTVSGDTGLRYVQSVPASTWTITNTLERYALVQVMDTTGKFVEGVVTQVKNNDTTYTVTVNFNEAIAGTALLI